MIVKFKSDYFEDVTSLMHNPMISRHLRDVVMLFRAPNLSPVHMILYRKSLLHDSLRNRMIVIDDFI